MKACMVAYSYYESDNRVRRYAETLAERGDEVSVISLRQKGQTAYGELNNVKVYRIQERVIDESGKLSYLKKLVLFFLKSSTLLTKEHLKQPYDLIHVHSVPDFQVFAALIPKLLGAKVILDIHDLVPEFYRSKFGNNGGALSFQGLKLVEKLSAGFSDHVIISNHLWEKILISRSCDRDKCTTILNYPNASLFARRDIPRPPEKIIMLYPGTLNWHQGLDIAIKAFSRAREKAPEAELHIYGDGPAKKELHQLVSKLNLNNSVQIRGLVPIEQIIDIMARAHIGIIPKRNDSFGGEAFSTKTLEFMCMGVPIIVARTKIDSFYFNDRIATFFEPENIEDLSTQMIKLIKHPHLREAQAQMALKHVASYSWINKKHVYLNILNSLVRGGQNKISK